MIFGALTKFNDAENNRMLIFPVLIETKINSDMKKWVLIIIAFFFANALMAQERTPAISFEKTVHDFGTIKEADGKVHYKFIFKNSGSTPLIITNVDAACGCTTPEWSKTPVLPGKTGFVDAEFNPENYQKFDKSIVVHTNGKPSTVTLRVIGEVIPKEKSLTDIFAYSFGSARVKGKNIAFASLENEQKEVVFEFYNDSKSDLKLSFSNLPGFVSVDKSPIVIKPQQIASVKFLANPVKAAKGFHKELIHLNINGTTYENALKIVASVK